LFAIEPLISKITPSEIGASSLEKCWIACFSPLSSNTKFSFSSPVTNLFIGSVIVTENQHQVHVTRIGLVRFSGSGPLPLPQPLANSG